MRPLYAAALTRPFKRTLLPSGNERSTIPPLGSYRAVTGIQFFAFTPRGTLLRLRARKSAWQYFSLTDDFHCREC
jgi:hypothetical protein